MQIFMSEKGIWIQNSVCTEEMSKHRTPALYDFLFMFYILSGPDEKDEVHSILRGYLYLEMLNFSTARTVIYHNFV